jgi:hypothetical protein
MATLVERPLTGPAGRLSSWTTTREARYLMAPHTEARDRMLAEVDDVIASART